MKWSDRFAVALVVMAGLAFVVASANQPFMLVPLGAVGIFICRGWIWPKKKPPKGGLK